jgi:hypothetical protein
MTTPTLICGAAVLGPVRFWELWDVTAYRNRSHLKRAVNQQFHTKTTRSTWFIPKAARRNKVALRDDCVKVVEENR